MVLEELYNKCPFPFFVIEPIIEGEACIDFRYIEVNDAFKEFLGKGNEGLKGKRFLELFEKAERKWLDVFLYSIKNQETVFKTDTSEQVGKVLELTCYPIMERHLACMIIETSNLYQEEINKIKKEVSVDYLTGLYNRHYLKNVYNVCEKSDYNLAFFDINDLKVVNDTYGHLAGDALIKECAIIIKDKFSDELCFRVGGDEFLVVSTNISFEVFEKRILELKETEFGNKVSVGYSHFENTTLSEAVDTVDKCMYCEKTKYHKKLKE